MADLLKHGGEDIDFEFYFNGKKIESHHTIFEMLKFPPHPLYKYKSPYSDSAVLVFAIRERHDSVNQLRKDSILDYQRKKSEVGMNPASSVETLVQQMIE